MEIMTDFSWAPKVTEASYCNHEIKRRLLLGRKAMTKLDSTLKSRDITLLTKVWYSQSYGFSRSHLWMWELDHKEGWMLKNSHFQSVVLEKNPLDCKEIKLDSPKGNQPWVFIGRTDAEAEAPVLWPPDAKNWLLRKDPDAGKDWRQEEKGTTEDELVGWHHRLNGHEFEQTQGDNEGQGSLACCNLWDRKESNMTEQLNNNSNSLPHWRIMVGRGGGWVLASEWG